MRELSLLAVELGVANLPVLGLLSRLELGNRRVLGPPHRGLGIFAASAQRRGHEPGDDRDDREREDELHG